MSGVVAQDSGGLFQTKLDCNSMWCNPGHGGQVGKDLNEKLLFQKTSPFFVWRFWFPPFTDFCGQILATSLPNLRELCY